VVVPESAKLLDNIYEMESKSRRVMQQPDDLTNIEFETSEDVKVIPTFDSMGLRDDLLRGIYA